MTINQLLNNELDRLDTIILDDSMSYESLTKAWQQRAVLHEALVALIKGQSSASV